MTPDERAMWWQWAVIEKHLPPWEHLTALLAYNHAMHVAGLWLEHEYALKAPEKQPTSKETT